MSTEDFRDTTRTIRPKGLRNRRSLWIIRLNRHASPDQNRSNRDSDSCRDYNAGHDGDAHPRSGTTGHRSEFDIEGPTVQLAITVYMLGLAIGQLFYGAVSDKYGRKPALLIGLLIYSCGMAIAVPANSIETLLAARFLQAIGACAGLVLGRAMVQDNAGEDNATGHLAVLTIALTLSPAFAPLIGQALVSYPGWRWIFGVLCLGGVVLMFWCWKYLSETNLRLSPNLDLMGMLRNFRTLGRSSDFIGLAAGGTSVSVTCFVFLGSLPFLVTEHLKLPEGVITLSYILIALSLAAGSGFARIMSPRVGAVQGARAGAAVTLVASALFFAMSFAGTEFGLLCLAPLPIFALGAGFASPNALGGALRVMPLAVGSASSLFGAIQMAGGTILTALPSLVGSQSPRTLGTIMLAVTLCGYIMLLRVRDDRH